MIWDDATLMMLTDALRGFWEWLLLIGALCGSAILLALPVFLFLFVLRLLMEYAVRAIRRRFIEGRV